MPTLEEVLASYADRLGRTAGTKAAEHVLAVLEARGVIPPEGQRFVGMAGSGGSVVAVTEAVAPGTAPSTASDGVRRPILPAPTQDRPQPGGAFGASPPAAPTSPPYPTAVAQPVVDPPPPPPPPNEERRATLDPRLVG
jgi:hypothetical protein